MRVKYKKTIFILYFVVLSMFMFPIFSYAQDDINRHKSDSETDLIIEDLEEKEITWKIVNASGIFADEDVQPDNQIRYFVKSANEKDNVYEVKSAVKMWGEDDFGKYGKEFDSDYFLVKRDWGAIAVDYFVMELASVWGTATEVNREYKAEYKTEWWNWRMMNTVTITFIMNETNHDTIKYSRAEGILLSRTTVVNANDGKIRGYLHIEMVEFTGFLELSPWYYIIVGSLLVVAFIAIIVTISLLVQRRKRIYREIDEI